MGFISIIFILLKLPVIISCIEKTYFLETENVRFKIKKLDFLFFQIYY